MLLATAVASFLASGACAELSAPAYPPSKTSSRAASSRNANSKASPSDASSNLLFAVSSDNVGAPAATEPVLVQEFARPFASPRNDVPGAPNLAQISPALWRSAQPNAVGFTNLKSLGIKTVVNLRNITSDRDDLHGTGLRYVHIHFAPWHAENEDVVKFLRVVSDPQNQPVLVHCQHGADRTGTMVAIYRVYVQGWSMDEAMQELPRFGFHSIWGNLKTYLRNLDIEALRNEVAAAPMPKVEVIQ